MQQRIFESSVIFLVSTHFFKLAGAVISWGSKKQATVALSTAEAEYMATCTATQEAVYLRKLLQDLRVPQSRATIIWQDNQSCIKMGKNAVFHNRTKHIDIKYHYVREMIENEVVQLQYVETQWMAADMLTKAVGGQILSRL